MFELNRIGEIVKQLSPLRTPQKVKLPDWQMRRTGGESRPVPTCLEGTWEALPASTIWGGHFAYFAFRSTVRIPTEMAGLPVEFTLRTGREGGWDATNPQFTLYVNGQLRQGLDVNHCECRLTDAAVAGECFDIFLSAYTGTNGFQLNFDAGLQTVDVLTEQLYYDLLVPWQTAGLLETDDPAYIELMADMTAAVNLLDLRKPGSAAYRASAQQAVDYLKETLYNGKHWSEALVRCVGHTHIDVAWLWTLSVTEDKSVRSFSTVLELMRRYPEYIFMSSQPQLYQYVKKNAPEIYEGIKARVAEGRWEPEGGMWLEADCNLASGEALVRQFLYGKRFFMKEFGKENMILWLPDVFGYSAALPQIMDKCGIRYFMTTKISWNDTNQIPNDTFYWKGIDGTKILTHFIPAKDYVKAGDDQRKRATFMSTYVGMMSPNHVKGGWQRYQQKKLNNEILFAYGYGDGGGGPTAHMLQIQRRLQKGLPGVPRTLPSNSLDFFRKLEQDLQGRKVPIWAGELYLEYHRATYTSMARNKRYNRKSEFALANVETQALLANRFCGKVYPEEGLAEQWEALLRNQFHDILPGSSIFEVYEDSRVEYEKLLAFAAEESADALQQLADGVGKTIVFNPNGQTMSGFVILDAPDGRCCVQKTADGKYLAWAEAVPSKGYAVLPDSAPEMGSVSISTQTVETPFGRIRFNDKGHICSWYDKAACREILQSGQWANVLMTYEDKPFEHDNWNVESYYREKSWPVEDLRSAVVVENGPYRYALELCWRYLDTDIRETLYFYPNTSRVDVRFTTDWKENQLLLKVLFPLALNTTEATFEIQYGNVKRSTTTNTSWDQARFEVCHHKWLDVAEGGYGVSILNDCKYGVGIEENVVGLTLLKCGTYPNPVADREYHEVSYSILPHKGSWQEAGTVREAYLLNNPMVCAQPACSGSGLPERYSAVNHDCRNIMVETVKKAEDTEDTVIRLYEFENTRTNVRLTLPEQAKAVWLCDMLERKQTLLGEDTDTVQLTAAPFEIITILVEA